MSFVLVLAAANSMTDGLGDPGGGGNYGSLFHHYLIDQLTGKQIARRQVSWVQQTVSELP